MAASHRYKRSLSVVMLDIDFFKRINDTHGHDMQTAAIKRMTLLNDLRYAVKNKELFIEYQPIVCFSSQKVMKAEALLRWQHPTKGRITPDEFIPLA
ncbi:MAG: EAL domain-containing protein, partial [Pseudomonadota bacterium]|nr:EAL domain-containing protein [Pseudomonadota bacterium]